MTLPLLPLLGAAVLVLLAGAAFLGVGTRQRRRAAGLTATAVTTRAEVIDVRPHDPNLFFSGNRVWRPVVRFALPDGRVVEAETTVGSNPVPARPGDRVEVRYDPREPRRVNLAHGPAQPGTLGLLLTVLGLAMTGVGLLVLGGWVLLALVLRVPA